jgi:rare lipoprotein A
MYAFDGRALWVCAGKFLLNSFEFASEHEWRQRRAVRLACLSLVAALGGCASTGGGPDVTSVAPMFPESKWGVSASQRVASETMPIQKGGGVYKVGTPYQVGGQWYDPREQPEYDRVGIASWYGSDFHGRKTANGEIYDMNSLTAAHPTLPMPSYVYVTNLANNRTLLVRVNDRGPYVAGRVIDLSRKVADALDLHQGGTGRVRVKYAGPAPMDGDDSKERQFLASRPWSGGSKFAANGAPRQTAALPSAYTAQGWSPAERPYAAREWSAQSQAQTQAQYQPQYQQPQQEGWSPPARPYAAREWPAQSQPQAQPRQGWAPAPSAYAAGEWSPSAYRAGLASR